MIIGTMSREWEALSELEKLASEYSDMHKEAHGCRPRGSDAGWTVADYEAAFKTLALICAENAERESEGERLAIAAVEETIAKLIATGAPDRAAAVRWLADAEDVGDDMEYLCYRMGLPYGYFKGEN